MVFKLIIFWSIMIKSWSGGQQVHFLIHTSPLLMEVCDGAVPYNGGYKGTFKGKENPLKFGRASDLMCILT